MALDQIDRIVDRASDAAYFIPIFDKYLVEQLHYREVIFSDYYLKH